ncbi:ATP-binding protein [Comamonas antarctica]|uniref:ATP-binding protein n=1 Tax=Comamonas antarctica TaxID=2743470 RepID=A0A6N1XA36_9BURK|nr:ATP-binding protein [Comamonas antarctica]
MVRLLSAQGLPVVEDPGRAILQERLARGIDVDRTGSSYMRFQQEVLERENAMIACADPGQRVFFDYGIAESLAFMKLAGLPWSMHFVDAAAALRFERVFLLSPLSIQNSFDGIRVETDAQRQKLWMLIGEVYQALGMQIVDVPNGSVAQRLGMVLAALT